MKFEFMNRFMLNEPPYVVLISNIGRPEMSSTSNTEPTRLSLTLNSWPDDPWMSRATPVAPVAAPMVRVLPSKVRLDWATADVVEEPVAVSILKLAGLLMALNPVPCVPWVPCVP